jgi:hypothetical protein
MTELKRFNAVPKLIGQDLNVVWEASDTGQWVEADSAMDVLRENAKLREALKTCIKESDCEGECANPTCPYTSARALLEAQ